RADRGERRLRHKAQVALAAARARGPLLRRRARHGRGPQGARQPPGAPEPDAFPLLSHRGHFQPRRPVLPHYVYFFGGGKADGNKDMKDLLGGKGSGLAEMTNAGLPVPPGFTVSTAACNLYMDTGGKLPPEIDEQIRKALARLEGLMAKRLGAAEDPLLVSVRRGAEVLMAGLVGPLPCAEGRRSRRPE